MTTIYDVSRMAGVSAKTVSRVLNEPDRVRPETRAQVQAAMKALEYTPNASARQLRLGGASSLGLLLEDPVSGYLSRFHHALLTACMEAGKHISVELFDMQPGWAERLDRFLDEGRVRDLILLPPLCDFAPLKAHLRQREARAVLIAPSVFDPHFPSVVMDDRAAAREVIEHLFALGHRRIGHISGHPDHSAAILRRQGLFEAYDAAGLSRPEPELMVAGDFQFRKGVEAAEALLSLPQPPTAIFAANDETAAAVSVAAHKRGLSIPGDLSVIGFDDAPIAAAVWPALTTIAQPYLDMSRRVVQALDNWDANFSSGTAATYMTAHSLIVRDSAGEAPR
ncbi:LacI family DNA-binding transcriptional regulator [Asticcacaulis excentricus]|uniref:Transcriptional regulator, LacI family n=1 Tax=Asticcacaulis excentricus (strain ATCC 15261 / DSM 4724 / KCTC 12464 / NCIMB 9791 / VKM B-1370 / CB 48) TaxID=573065 RepID=E8RLH6_ASTEC|nr:LacI family DNA-binding transcriptional regulator [Asticcacaulis excentricus]ADU13720.1 transcriptional regulator, LacI family [Asticcacaulis excentricus CB 48]